MIAGMSLYEICWYFCIYSFFGWVLEVAYHGVTLGKVVNRGFLNGPVCPVYGFGMVTVLALGNAVERAQGSISVMSGTDEASTLLLFLGGVLLTTAVELLGGWMLDKLFHARWWDYSNQPLNFHGYICLKFSIIWGLAVVFIVRIVQPLLEKRTTSMIPEKYGWPVLAILGVLWIADLVVTVLTVVGLNKKLEEIDRLSASMRTVSDRLSETVGTTSIVTAQHIQEGQVQAALAKAEIRDAAEAKREEIRDAAEAKRDEIRDVAESKRGDVRAASEARRAELEKRIAALREDLRGHRAFGTGRLLQAFPGMKHREHEEALKEIIKE